MTFVSMGLNQLSVQSVEHLSQGFFSPFWEHDPTPRIGNFSRHFTSNWDNKSTARRGIIRPKAVLFTQVAKFYRNFRSKLKRKIRKNCDLFVCLTLYVPLTFSNFI